MDSYQLTISAVIVSEIRSQKLECVSLHLCIYCINIVISTLAGMYVCAENRYHFGINSNITKCYFGIFRDILAILYKTKEDNTFR